MQIKRWHVPAFSIVVAALSLIVFWPGVTGPFLFDDYPNIVSNARVHPTHWDWGTFRSALTGYAPGTIGRPFATLWFAQDYLIGGKSPWVFKVSSIALHALNAVLVLSLLRALSETTRTAASSAWGISPVVCVTLLWALHPLQVSTVLYVVQRMEMLATTFVLMALIAYLVGRHRQIDGKPNGWWLIGLSIALAGLGLLAKETATLFPVLAVALELTVLNFEARLPRDQKWLKRGAAVFILLAGVTYLAWILPNYYTSAPYPGRYFNTPERLLTQLRVLVLYTAQIVLPLPGQMTFYYDDFSISQSLLKPVTTLLSGLFLASLLFLAWRVRKKWPLVSLGVFWFFGSHLLTSNVLNLELVFEHRNYFAILGIMIAAAELVQKIKLRDGPALKYFAVGAIIIAFSAMAMIRSATWGNELLLAADLAAKNPRSPRAASDLATLYIGMSNGDPESPFFAFGQNEFERASRLPFASPLPEQGLILMQATYGRPVKDAWWVSLIEKLKTQPAGIQQQLAVTGLLSQRVAGVTLDDARLSQALAALLATQPSSTLFLQSADYALNYLKNERLASSYFVSAARLSQKDPAFVRRLAAQLASEGQVDIARSVLATLEHPPAK